jgi:hypothetical protein
MVKRKTRKVVVHRVKRGRKHYVIFDEGSKVKVRRGIKGNTYKGDRIAKGKWSKKRWSYSQKQDKSRFGKYEKWERKTKKSKPYKKRRTSKKGWLW